MVPSPATLLKLAEQAAADFKGIATRLKADATKRARSEVRALATQARDEITEKLLKYVTTLNR